MIKLTDAGTEVLLATEKITKLINRIEDLEGEIIYLREIVADVLPFLEQYRDIMLYDSNMLDKEIDSKFSPIIQRVIQATRLEK